MRRRRILITGAGGRLGSALTFVLGAQHDIVQLSLEAPRDPAQHAIGDLFVGSILDPALIAQGMEGVDTVIHSAAIPGPSPPYYRLVETNVLGTFHMLEEAGARKEVEQFIFISSVQYHGIFGFAPDSRMPHYLPINEEHPSVAINPYACSKVQAEYWCRNYVERFHKPVVAIRPTWILPLESMATFAAGPAMNRPHLHDYVATTDLLDGIMRAIEYDPPSGFDAFLFSAGDQRTTTPSLELTERLFPGVPVNTEKLRAYDGFGALVDCAHAKEKLGWTPQYRRRR